MPSTDPTDTGSIDTDDPPIESPASSPKAGGERRSRQLAAGERASTATTMLIADLLDTEPTSLSPPMHEAFDPEALDRLFERPPARPTDFRVEFELYGCRVAIGADRRIDVHRIS